MKKLLVLLAVTAGALVASALPAVANSGAVATAQDCNSWSASVSLNHNVQPDRTVEVITTIPGTSGLTGKHYDTSFGTIWSESGPAPQSGTVTLNIFQGDSLEFTQSASLPPADECVSTTTTSIPPPSTSTSTSTSSTSSTSTSTSTSVPVTTTTECQDHTLPCAGPPPTLPFTGGLVGRESGTGGLALFLGASILGAGAWLGRRKMRA